ncbi:MAG: hypothetical protein ACERKZ_02410 [Lachnotalea sp.]
MEKDAALFEVVVMAEQIKQLISLVSEGMNDSQAQAIVYVSADYLNRIIKLTESYT